MNTRLQGVWLTLARVVWLALMLVAVGMFAVGTVEKYAEPFPLDCSQVGACNPIELSVADLELVQSRVLSTPAFAALWTSLTLLQNLLFVAMAGLIFWQRSDDWMALLVSATLGLLGTMAFSPANTVVPITHPEWEGILAVWETGAYVSLLVLLLIFPDGRFVPRWTRFALPLLLPFLGVVVVDAVLALAFIALTFIAYAGIAIYAQIYRYRQVSNLLQRQQTKWVMLGLFSIALLMGGWLAVALSLPPERPSLTRTYTLLAITPLVWVVGPVLPASVVIAVLRYRLWDIDVIVRRTLVYSALTAALALTYFGGVVLLQSLFSAVGIQQSSAAIVLSTLGMAALFSPLRRRIQDIIDRRFYRHKYDAAQALAAFAASARDQTDLDALTAEVQRVVRETIQPQHISFWLKPRADGRPERLTSAGSGRRGQA
jgi:hypothetical protein